MEKIICVMTTIMMVTDDTLNKEDVLMIFDVLKVQN